MKDHKSDLPQDYKFTSLNLGSGLKSNDFKDTEFLKPVTQFSKLNPDPYEESKKSKNILIFK